MRALYLLALVSLAVFGLSVAVDYQPIAAYCEGTALNIWSFGASTAASRTIGTAYTPAVIYPGTNTTGADAEVGEIHVLKCAGGTNCPDVVRFSISWASFFPLTNPPALASSRSHYCIKSCSLLARRDVPLSNLTLRSRIWKGGLVFQLVVFFAKSSGTFFLFFCHFDADLKNIATFPSLFFFFPSRNYGMGIV